MGGGAITEGGDATFTVTANPAPTGTIAITFVAMVTQDGRFTSSDGQVVETIGPSGSNTITVSTLDDDRDEPPWLSDTDAASGHADKPALHRLGDTGRGDGRRLG